MSSNIIQIISLIILLILLELCIFYWLQCSSNNNEHFESSKINTSLSNPELAYADASEPYIMPMHLEKFITTIQCNEIISASENNLFDSETVGGKNKNIRNSQQFWISKYDPIAKPLFENAANMFNIPFDNAEDLQIVRYLPGQFFNEHHDSCCDNNEKCIDFAKKGGQRILTVLIYLNDNFEGGYTYFKNLDMKFKINKGDALVFYPLAAGTNKCHPNALHAGMPVTNGIKWIANLWFREGKFQP